MTVSTRKPASTSAVANELLELCRAGKNLEAIDRLYADDIVSIEAAGTAESPRASSGKESIRGKNQWWLDNHEIHSASANGPYVGDGQFAAQFTYDVTFKESEQRFLLEEMALYDVKDGKIVREQFFYNMPAR